MVKALGTMLVFLWTLILLVYIANAQDKPDIPPATSGPFTQYAPGEVIIKFKEDVLATERDKFIEDNEIKEKGRHSATGTLNFTIPKGEDPKKFAEKLKLDPRVEYAEPNWIAPRPGMQEAK